MAIVNSYGLYHILYPIILYSEGNFVDALYCSNFKYF
jgi:hypothetical protein